MQQHIIHLLLGQKIRQPYIEEGLAHYIKKLHPFVSIIIHTPKDKKRFEEYCRDIENQTHIIVVCDERGKQLSSVNFSKKLESLLQQQTKDICFVIGGAEGIPYIPKHALLLSISTMTLNHEMVPLVLLEQIYRGYLIMKGHPYHRA